MRETNEVNALYTFLSFLVLPAVLFMIFGVRTWYYGKLQENQDKIRMGKMIAMFGIIFIVILFICSYFLKGTIPG
jgi:low temperature requirement protein LtrA